jgi:predicted DNA-binding antitoxin AbrB/MazE fold protein
MTQTASAIYENGVLRPMSQLSNLREGQLVQITVSVPQELMPEEVRREAEFIRGMEAAGMIERLVPPGEPAPVDWKPLVVEGEPLSETVIKMRREE